MIEYFSKEADLQNQESYKQSSNGTTNHYLGAFD